MKLIDSFGRKINYLRLSVTDRCNMRCRYCMPAEGVAKLCHEDILSYEALFRIAQSAVALGIEKIRVTGGEPLVRKGIIDFLARLAGIPGLKQLVLTTNGLRLAEMAEELRAAGVQRLNISLDSLQPEVFARITRGGDLSRVLAGITAAERAGFPIKINMVVMRGINDAEVVDVASLALHKPYTVRFIEYMPAIKERELAVPAGSRPGNHGPRRREIRIQPGGQERSGRTCPGIPDRGGSRHHWRHHPDYRPFLRRVQPDTGDLQRGWPKAASFPRQMWT